MLTFSGLSHTTDFEFTDISSELWRQYDFHDYSVRIERPVALAVSKSGGHRVLDARGVSHYIVYGWAHLSWAAGSGSPHFVK